MKSTAIYTLSVICILLVACTNNKNRATEKYQNNRNNIVNVSDNIVDIKTNVIFGRSFIYSLDSFLFIDETEMNIDKGIHVFNMNTLTYITSTGIRGQGPGELTQFGIIGIDHKNKNLWVTDNAKQLKYKFPLDSILNNSSFKPTISVKLNNNFYLSYYDFYNDSILYGRATDVKSYDKAYHCMAKTNLNTNTTIKYGYEHSELIGKRANDSAFKLVPKNNIYINAFCYCDLLTICNIDGSLKRNIYGPDQLNNIITGKKTYYCGIEILNNYIIASYCDDSRLITPPSGLRGNCPNKFLVFDMDGNYIETIETGEGNKVEFFCVDEANNRIICYFLDRENPLGYFNFNLK